MKIELTRDQLVELGSRYRSGYLMEQYGYTNGLAAAEGAPLVAVLAANFLTETKAVADKGRKAEIAALTTKVKAKLG